MAAVAIAAAPPAYVPKEQLKNLESNFHRGSPPVTHCEPGAGRFVPDATGSDKMEPWRKSGRPS